MCLLIKFRINYNGNINLFLKIHHNVRFLYRFSEPTYKMIPDERPELRDVKRILKATLEGKISIEFL